MVAARPTVSYIRDIDCRHEPTPGRAAEGQHRTPLLGAFQENVADDRRTGKREAVDESPLQAGRAPDSRQGQIPEEGALCGIFGRGGGPQDVIRDVCEDLLSAVAGECVDHAPAGREIHHGAPVDVPQKEVPVALALP